MANVNGTDGSIRCMMLHHTLTKNAHTQRSMLLLLLAKVLIIIPDELHTTYTIIIDDEITPISK